MKYHQLLNIEIVIDGILFFNRKIISQNVLYIN